MNNRIKTIFHKFRMGDVEDPYLYAASPIYDWQKTEQGTWCMSRSVVDTSFLCIPSPEYWGYEVVIYGELKPEDHTYFQLRWGFDDRTN
jgi:hypothetical protein